MRATTPPLPFFSRNSLTRIGAVLQFPQDSTWPHLCSCLPVALSTHLRETRAYHPISEAEGQYPSSNQNSSPSFFYSVGIPHGHTSRACHWNFQHTYEDMRHIPIMSGVLPNSIGRKTTSLRSLGDSTWPHSHACCWSFQHFYEDTTHHEWRIIVSEQDNP